MRNFSKGRREFQEKHRIGEKVREKSSEEKRLSRVDMVVGGNQQGR